MDPAAGLTCPRCGAPCSELTGSVSVDGTESVVRVPVSCPECTAPLALVVRQTTDEPSDATPGTTGRRPATADESTTDEEVGTADEERDDGSAGGPESTTDEGTAPDTADTPGRIGVELWLEDRREDDEDGLAGQ